MAQRVVDAVAPVGAAHIPAPALAPVTAQTEHALQIVLLVAVLRAEAGRVQAARVPAGEHTAAVIDRGGAIGIAPVEITDAFAVAVQTETVEVDAVVQGEVEVEAEMAVFQVRLAPALHRIGHDQIRVGVLEGDRIGALAAARGRVGSVPVGEQRQAALVTQREAVPAADLATGPIAFAVFGQAQRQFPADAVIQDDVDHPGDGVRAVLRRRAITQHFDALDRMHRNLRQVRPLRAACAQQRRTVEAAAVDQHQGLVRRETPQRGRPHEHQAIVHRHALDHEGRHQLGQHVVEVGRLDRLDLFLREHVHRGQRVELGAVAAARAGDDHRVQGGGGRGSPCRGGLGTRIGGRGKGKDGQHRYSKHTTIH